MESNETTRTVDVYELNKVQYCNDNVLTMYYIGLVLGRRYMDFDWADLPFEWEGLTSKDVEESFEDPFSCKFLPDSPRFSEQSRYFNLGMSASGYGIFSVYRTNGKQIRVVMARGFTEDETFFYQRKMNQLIS